MGLRHVYFNGGFFDKTNQKRQVCLGAPAEPQSQKPVSLFELAVFFYFFHCCPFQLA